MTQKTFLFILSKIISQEMHSKQTKTKINKTRKRKVWNIINCGKRKNTSCFQIIDAFFKFNNHL